MIRKLNKMIARDHTEQHRTATTLELFFDLVYVVAIAAAASGLHHSLAELHFAHGFFAYGVAFFAIWLAWINYTWFASAYNTDDVPFRLCTFIQIFGALVLAVGVKDIFLPEPSFTITVLGYVIMRVAMVLQWLRAAREDEGHRGTCLRYAIGIAVAQIGWVVWLFLPLLLQRPIMPLLMLAEMLLPVYAEQRNKTTWHPHHIAERYGLLTIIVLGEGILGATNTIAELVHNDSVTFWFSEIFPLGFGALAVIFALWWSYFNLPWGHILEHNRRGALLFGYMHFFVFASLGAVGAGLELVSDAVRDVRLLADGTPPVSPILAIAVVSGAISIYLFVLSFLRLAFFGQCRHRYSSFALAIIMPGIPVLLVYCGFLLQWALILTVIAPVLFILICDQDRETFHRQP